MPASSAREVEVDGLLLRRCAPAYLYILLGQESKSDEPVLDNAHRCNDVRSTLQLAFHSDII